MSDPERIVDSGTDEERDLLASLRSCEPSPARGEKLAASLGLAAGLSAAAATKSASAASTAASGAQGAGALSLKAWIGVGVLGAAAIGGGGYAIWQQSDAEFDAAKPRSAEVTSPRVVSQGEPARVAEPDSARELRKQVVGQPADALPPVSPPREASPFPATPPTKAPDSKSAEPTFEEELTLIDGAREALAAGDSNASLRLLGEHRSRFPAGRLRLEAEVLRIRALEASGKHDQARQRAQRFIQRHPTSMLAQQLRSIAGTKESVSTKEGQ